MYFIALLSATMAATAFSQPVIAKRAAQATGQPFEITNVTIADIKPGNTTLSFKIHDPDPLTNATGICQGTWKHNTTGYPQGTYSICSNTAFAWNMYAYNSLDNFTLGVEHRFQDPSVGDPPYDHVINFGKTQINSTNVPCSKLGGKTSCLQGKKVIHAPIYATVAK